MTPATAHLPVSRRTELITPEAAEALAGLLDIDPPDADHGGVVPPLWHWVYLLTRHRERELGPDGHPILGVPEPPGPDWTRLFAGGRVLTHTPLRFGEAATRTTRLLRSVDKQGRSGPLTFVTIRTEIEQRGSVVIADEQDIVYRHAGGPPLVGTAAATGTDTSAGPNGAGPGGAGAAPGNGRVPGARRAAGKAASGRPDAGGHHLDLAVDPVLLFRFSALTYNAHRIHYDRDYAVAEGYPDLVVHGPLQALLMSEVIRRAGLRMTGKEFSYRLVAPTFGTQWLTAATHPADGPGRDAACVTAQVRDGAGTVTATGRLR